VDGGGTRVRWSMCVGGGLRALNRVVEDGSGGVGEV